MHSPTETFQLSLEAAEMYETKFVPALFEEWAPHLVRAAGVSSGQAVLDVACGTGVVAREAADRMAGSGRVVGVDINEGMLAVAGRLRPDIEWKRGDATNLPFSDAQFDVALCQAALMFFADRQKALREMARVVRPGGTIAVQVWAALEEQPGYRPFVEAAARHAGPGAADLLGAYWALGDLDLVTELFNATGLEVTDAATRMGTVRFGSIEELVRTEIEASPLIERIDTDTYRRILEDSRETLAGFATETGSTRVPIRGHLITARRR